MHSTDALTFESVALLVIFAILSLLPGLYHNRESIKSRLQKIKECCGNCCCNVNNDNNASEESTSQTPRSSIRCNGARTPEEAINMCQRKKTSPHSSP